jgi:hypothetical protein
VVEARTVVRDKLPWEEEEREKMDGFQAMTVLPREPLAFRVEKSERRVGRKEWSLRDSREESLVPWRQATVGVALEVAVQTRAHLSSSPSPCVFHDNIERFLNIGLHSIINKDTDYKCRFGGGHYMIERRNPTTKIINPETRAPTDKGTWTTRELRMGTSRDMTTAC